MAADGQPPRPRRRLLWLLVDGLGDTAVPQLGHRSPLEAAATPMLDQLAGTPPARDPARGAAPGMLIGPAGSGLEGADGRAAAGWTGLLDPVEPGLACGSDTAHLSLLGYDPRRYAARRM